MPSLHGAYPMLICLFFWKDSSPRKRILLAAYPICMAFSLVYTAEHFVIDIFVGWIYAAAGLLLRLQAARPLGGQAPAEEPREGGWSGRARSSGAGRSPHHLELTHGGSSNARMGPAIPPRSEICPWPPRTNLQRGRALLSGQSWVG